MIHVDVIGTKYEDAMKALEIFNKKVKKSGILEEVRRREAYMKPSVKRKFKTNEAIKQRKRDVRIEMRKKYNNNTNV